MIFYNVGSCEIFKRVQSLDAGRYSLVLGVLQVFSLSANANPHEAALATPTIWELAEAYMGPQANLDECWPKAQSEFLAYGSCYASNAKSDVQPIAASIRIGELSKTLAIYGDRSVSPLGQVSKPQPIHRVEISPENAFGGSGYALNPAGKGYRSTQAEVSNVPNVELPRSTMISANDQPEPAGFWGFGPDMPQRMRHLGTFDEEWQRKRWPHLPLDTRAGYFQAAAVDQQFSTYLKGDEVVEIHNMHPSHARVQSQLPGMRCRILVNHTSPATQSKIVEYRSNIDTVLLFPDALSGAQIFRCVIPVTDADSADISHVMIELESLDQSPASFDALYARFIQQMNDEASENSPTVQAVSPTPPMTALAEVSSSGVAMEAASLEGVSELDHNPTAVSEALQLKFPKEGAEVPKLPPEIAALLGKDDFGSMTELDHLLNIKAEIQKSNDQIRGILKEGGINDPELIKVLKANPKTAADALFLQSAPTDLENMMKSVEQDIDDMIAAEKASPTPIEEDTLAEASAPLVAAPIVPETETHTREWVVKQYAEGKSFAGHDLTGLDLSNLDLNAADFQESVLASVNFSKSRLANAIFEDAILSGANFETAILKGANLRRVSAEDACFVGASLELASMREADFSSSDFTSANLYSADLKASILSMAKLVDTQAVQVTADEVQMDQADCSRTNFTEARMAQANFYRANLSGAVFTQTNCKRSDFSGVSARLCQFNQADLSDSQADFKSNFDEAIFDNANLSGLNWNKASIASGRFDRANLNNADLTGCVLTGSRMVGVEGKKLCLDRCDLTGADLSGINAFEGSMRNANLQRVNMIGANLFGVDFLDAKIEGMNYQGSLIGRTLLELRQS